jgi:hypothetical protein
MARVIGAVANGDLSQKMDMEVEGRPLESQFLRTAKTVNTLVDQLGSFASEVTRVARKVGTEGKLGGQAQVRCLPRSCGPASPRSSMCGPARITPGDDRPVPRSALAAGDRPHREGSPWRRCSAYPKPGQQRDRQGSALAGAPGWRTT